MARILSALRRFADFSDFFLDGGASRRLRHRREAWLVEGCTDAVRRTERWGWVGGVLRAEQGVLEFSSEAGATTTVPVKDIAVEGRGPSLMGPTVIIRAITPSGHREEFAVPRKAAPSVMDLLTLRGPR